MYESEDKKVSHPYHYQTNSGLEAIDVINAFTDGLEGIEAVCTGNALKYMMRWKKKNGVQDIEKAIWYMMYLKEHLTSDLPELIKNYIRVDKELVEETAYRIATNK